MTRKLLQACGAALILTASGANAAMLTTTFAGGNGQSGNMFDINVFANPLTVTSLDLNLDTGTWDLELYVKSGSHVGSTTTPGDWTLIDTIAGVTSNGPNVATPVDFLDFVLAANATTALYVTVTNGTSINYTNGSTTGAVFASNVDLAILEGAGIPYPFGGNFNPRVWNGTIQYDVGAAAVPEPSSISLLVAGALLLAGRLRKRNVTRD